MRNNQEQVAERIRNLINNEFEFEADVVADDGSVIVNSNNDSHNQIVSFLENESFPEVSDGVQAGNISVVNSESDEIEDIN